MCPILGDRPTNGGIAGSAGPRSFDKHRTQARPAPGRLRSAAPASGEAFKRVVRADGADDRANRHQLVHPLGQAAGKCSQISMPETLVRIGWNSPRISAGASIFKSKKSWCGGPPGRKIMMIPLCVCEARRSRLGLKNLRQRKAAQGQPADFQKRSSRDSIAKAVLRPANDIVSMARPPGAGPKAGKVWRAKCTGGPERKIASVKSARCDQERGTSATRRGTIAFVQASQIWPNRRANSVSCYVAGVLASPLGVGLGTMADPT